MPDANETLPDIAHAITHIGHALVPSSLKALNRLVGALADIPAAYAEGISERVRSKTRAQSAVDDAISKAAALLAAGDDETVNRALDVLVRKEYRKQVNRQAVAKALLEDLRTDPDQSGASSEAPQTDIIEDDWLNVFERYAEDASTERMQKLWGRVLAGEVRKPGRFSMRTLRFLSEFSQADALLFADFCSSTFAGLAPRSLVVGSDVQDIRWLLNLETAGLISGASAGLQRTIQFDSQGVSFLVEGDLALQFRGAPETPFATHCLVLTPLGQELISLLPDHDVVAAARKVALAMRQDIAIAAHLLRIGTDNLARPMEILWEPPAPTVDATPS